MAEEENKVENKVDPQDHTSPAIKKKELNYDIQDGVKETPAAEVAPMQETVTEKNVRDFSGDTSSCGSFRLFFWQLLFWH